MSTRTLFDDLNDPERGIIGNFYVNGRKGDCIYRVEGFLRNNDSAMFNAVEYNIHGERKSQQKMTYELSDCFEDSAAPATFRAEDSAEAAAGK